jgi:adenylate cyclase
VSDRVQEVAERANVPEDFVRQLVAADALPGEEGELGLAGAVRRVRLLRSWTAAGLSVETILTLVNRGALSLAFLDAPVMVLPERLDYSYEQLAADHGVPMSFLRALHQSLGFAPPESGDRAGEDDATMLEVARLFRGAGVADDATLRLLAVYADNLRRIVKAEADYYEANVERRLRAEGLDERQLIELGTQLGDRVIGLLERVLVMVYRRRREHVWTEHAINHVEEALEGSGLQHRVAQPPAICFVDLTGYTRLTEERGDEAAAQVAGRLVALVNDISRRRGGRPVRWLGDGGMFYFREPGTAVVAGLDLVERGPCGRSAAGPCGHPHRPCHLTRRRRLRKDCEPGGSDRFLCTGWAGGGEPGDGAALRRSPGVVRPAGSGRAQGRRRSSAALSGLPQVLGVEPQMPPSH